MKKIEIFVFSCFLFTQSFAQTERKVSTYLFTQYTKTINDYTIGNNPWAMGLGLQAFLNTNTKFKPTLEITGDIYLADDKVLRFGTLNPDGSIKAYPDVPGMVNIFAGTSFHPAKDIYFSLVAGPSFIGDQTLLGLKPSFGFYFAENKRWTGKISYINVFNRGDNGEDFGSMSFAIGLKLF